MLSHNITIAWRNICKYGSQNIISVLGLSASLVCFSFCMHFARYLMGIDKHFDNYDRIAEIGFHDTTYVDRFQTFSVTEGERITKLPLNTLEKFSMVIVSYPHDHFYEDNMGRQGSADLGIVDVDSAFADFFGVKIVAGSWEKVASLPNSMVLSESEACRKFGSATEAIGRTIGRTDINTLYTVRAVMADIPGNISFYQDGIDALKLNDEDSPRVTSSQGSRIHIFGLMPKGVTLEDVNRELTNSVQPIMAQIEDNNLIKKNIVATCMGESQTQNVAKTASIITTFAILILSVGLLNFLHFLIGSILNRSREYSLRRLFGCRMRDLFGLLFTQTFMLLCATAFVCSYATSVVIPLVQLPGIVSWLRIDASLMWWQMVEYIGWLLLACIVICAGVCFYIRHITIQQGVTGFSSAPRIRRHLGRNLMMGLQFFICWVFVSLTVGFYIQTNLSTSSMMSNLSHKEKEEILSFTFDSRKTTMRPDEKQVFINRLKTHAGVKDILPMNNMLESITGSGIFTEPDRNYESSISILYKEIPQNFFDFMNIGLVRGVWPETPEQIAVDEDLAAKYDEDILGHTFYQYGTTLTVTAVVKNSTYMVRTAFGMNDRSTIYMSNKAATGRENPNYIYVKCYPGQVKAVREFIMEELHKVLATGVDVRITTLKEEIEENQGVESLAKELLLFFAIVSLSITLLGVYSAITLDTERRRREVALRKVHGARFPDILWLFGRRYFYLLVIPFVLALPIVYYIFSLMSSNYITYFNYGPFFWIGIFLSVALLVVLTVLWRILQVAHTRPAEEIAKG